MKARKNSISYRVKNIYHRYRPTSSDRVIRPDIGRRVSEIRVIGGARKRGEEVKELNAIFPSCIGDRFLSGIRNGQLRVLPRRYQFGVLAF